MATAAIYQIQLGIFPGIFIFTGEKAQTKCKFAFFIKAWEKTKNFSRKCNQIPSRLLDIRIQFHCSKLFHVQTSSFPLPHTLILFFWEREQKNLSVSDVCSSIPILCYSMTDIERWRWHDVGVLENVWEIGTFQVEPFMFRKYNFVFLTRK